AVAAGLVPRTKSARARLIHVRPLSADWGLRNGSRLDWPKRSRKVPTSRRAMRNSPDRGMAKRRGMGFGVGRCSGSKRARPLGLAARARDSLKSLGVWLLIACALEAQAPPTQAVPVLRPRLA